VPPTCPSRTLGARAELAEAAETVAEDLGHALEESVGEVLDAVGRAWRADPWDLPAIAARAAGHVVAGWVAADRHAAGRLLVAVGRLASLVVTPRSP
jgi:hypothetical protein